MYSKRNTCEENAKSIVLYYSCCKEKEINKKEIMINDTFGSDTVHS